MENRFKYLLKNTSVLTISNFSSKILVFLMVPLYTRVLSTQEYGEYDLIVTTVQLLIPILTVNMYEGVMRYIMDAQKSKEQVVSIGLKYISIGTLIFGAIIILNRFLGISQLISRYSIFVFLYFLFSLLNQFYIQLVKGFEKVKALAVSGVLGTLATVGLNILFLLYFKLGLVGYFYANILSLVIQVLFLGANIKIHKYITRKIDKKTEKEMITYSFPLVFNTIGWWVNSAADRYIVTFICGIAVNGIYSVAYKIPSILNIFQNIFIQAWQISAIKEYESHDSKKFYGNALEIINCLMSICCMFLIILTVPIAKILYANDFFSAWKYVPFLLVSSVINAASGVLGPILSAKKESKAMGMSAVYGAVTNIGLNFVLVYFIGAQGAAIATAVSSFVIYICRRRAVGESIDSSADKKLFMSWILLCVQSLIAIYTGLYIVQAVIILLYSALTFKNLKQIMNRFR